MQTFSELEKYIKGMADKNATDLMACKENIKKATDAIEKAEKDIVAAETAVDPKKYSQAKESLWTAKHTKELYLKQKEKIEKNPVIDKKEYTKLVNEIMDGAKALQEEQNTKAAKLVIKLKELSDESEAVKVQANRLLHVLQYDVFKDADALVAANGTVITREKEYQNYESVSDFFSNKVAGTFLADRAGIKKEEPRRFRSFV
jgi:hypothetical protein